MFPVATGRRPAILDLSSPEITMDELAVLAQTMRNAQYDVEATSASVLWVDITLLRLEVRAEFLKRYVQRP
jgi:hypothetical protein